MSLILRKNCQPTLDSLGLNEHHVSINNNKALQVTCECGKPFLTLPGITFTRTTPSKDEIAYATELFQEFTKKHKKEIAKFLKDLAKFEKKPALESPVGVSVSTGGYNRNYKGWTLVYKDGPFQVSVDLSTDLTIENASVTTKSVPLAELQTKISLKLMNTKVKEFADYRNYVEEKSKYANLQILLEACEI